MLPKGKHVKGGFYLCFLWVTFHLNGDKQPNLSPDTRKGGQQIAEANATALMPAINARDHRTGVRLRLLRNTQHLCLAGCKLCPHAFSLFRQILPPSLLSLPAQAEPWSCGFRSGPSLPNKLPRPCSSCHAWTM